jgi:hypothetical protein
MVLGAEDDAAWSDVLARLHRHDFHHLAGYHRVAERRGEGTAALFAHRDGDFVIALPLLLRPIDDREPDGLQDATSVYGYGGPVASHERMPQAMVRTFQEELRQELARRRVVAVFSRLHPLIDQRELVAGLGEIRIVGETVSVDLSLSLDEQWAGYSKKCRRVIRRAMELGVTCREDRDWKYRREWAEMYDETMERVAAPASYRYDAAYFDLLASELGPALRLFVACHEGTLAAAGLYTICGGIVQAHLGASRTEFAKLSPTRLLDDTARRWAVDAGADVFHLGGGVGGQQDSLFQYKAGFSDRRHEFAVWRWVLNPITYAALSARHLSSAGHGPDDSPADDFFPAYRRPLTPP